MNGLARVFDAAYPPSAPPAGAAGVLGYIGGANALNTWTAAEWQPFARLAQFQRPSAAPGRPGGAR